MQTERQYLIDLGYAVPSRAPLSKAAREVIAEARANGMQFAEPKPRKPIPDLRNGNELVITFTDGTTQRINTNVIADLSVVNTAKPAP